MGLQGLRGSRGCPGVPEGSRDRPTGSKGVKEVVQEVLVDLKSSRRHTDRRLSSKCFFIACSSRTTFLQLSLFAVQRGLAM